MDVLHRGIEGVVSEDMEAYLRTSMASQVDGDCIASYDLWAIEGNYEKHLNENIYRGPKVVSEKVDKYYNQGLLLKNDKRSVEILDVAAGTGLVGEKLKEYGFTLIDALDPSTEMLNLARKKNIYRNHISEGVPISSDVIGDCTYDVVISSGGMGEGHIPVEGIDDMYRIAKVGGIVVIVMRTEYMDYVDMYKEKLRPRIKQLIDEGCWKPIEDSDDIIGEIRIDNYSFHKQGSLFSYKKIK